jgi:hypothetical protein
MAQSRDTFKRSAGTAIATLAVLAVFQLVPLPKAKHGVLSTVDLIKKTVKTRGLSAEAREEQTVGYYQELLDGATTVVAKTPGRLDQFVGGRAFDAGAPELEELTANQAHVNQQLHDFLVYRPRPNLNLQDPRFSNVHTVTNSQGWSDQEYSFERMPRTRRVVVLGDSMARALGVPPGGGFEPRLEASLNQHDRRPDVERFEIINMGVSGYRLTQMVDIALTEAPRYDPDAYVVVVSWLTIARKWGLHLAQLVDQGIDLKYDFLRDIVRQAGLKKGDGASTTEARLAPYMLPTLRWMLTEIRRVASAKGASVAVVLIPHLKGIGSYERDFGPVRALLQEEHIPYADLLNVFDDVDISTLDIGDGLHPNADGHEMLFRALLGEMAAKPELSAVVRGQVPSVPTQ